MKTVESVALLGEMADLCGELSRRSTQISAEASVATTDNDLALAQRLIDRAEGINEAVSEMLARARPISDWISMAVERMLREHV